MLIRPELFILVPVLNLIGTYIKKTGIIKNWAIPLTLGTLGIVVSILVLGFDNGFTPSVILDGILQGILSAGVAVYAHQLKIQTARARLGE
ncbi:MAG: holin [Clostridiales bacterium]|nr:holin [Clostridiales bacterium]